MRDVHGTTYWPAVLVLILAARLSPGAEAEPNITLKAGDPAPELYTSKWLNGKPVKGFEKDTVYVLECWATWCGPCLAVVPHVSALNTKYKDKGVVFIGLNVFERDLAGVEPLVKKLGKTLNYRVAYDEVDGKNGTTGKSAMAWLKASGQQGIPCSFIVDKQGQLAWIGHPSRMEKILAQVVEGTFDFKKHAEMEAHIKVLQGKFQDAMDGNDASAKIKTMDDLIAAKPDMAPYLEHARFKILLLGTRDYEQAYVLGARLAQGRMNDDADGLNDFAWTVLDAPGIEKRDLDLAMKWALRADELTGHSDGPVLDTLARAYYEKGQLDKAISIQTRSVEKSPGKTDAAVTLMKYTQKKISLEQSKFEVLMKKVDEAVKTARDALKKP